MHLSEQSRFVQLISGSLVLHGYSIAEAAKTAKINASYLSHILHEGPKVPSAEWIRKISRIVGAPWLPASVNEHMFLAAAWATWANPIHFGFHTTPPVPTIIAQADRLSTALQPITDQPLPIEMISEPAELAIAHLFADLSSSYQLPGAGSLPAGHQIASNVVAVLLAWGLVAGGGEAIKEAESWLQIGGRDPSYVAEMLAQAFPRWIAAHPSRDNSPNTSAGNVDADWSYVQEHWLALTPRQRELVAHLIASWFPQ